MTVREKFLDWDLTISQNVYNDWVVYARKKLPDKTLFYNFEHKDRAVAVQRAKKFVETFNDKTTS